VAAAFVDEGGPVAGGAVKLGPVRLAAFGQLVAPISHPLQPLARFELAAVVRQTVEDVVDASGRRQVGGEARQAVVDDVRVRVIESGEDRRPAQIDHPCPRPPQLHDLAAAASEDLAGGDRQVGLEHQAGASQRADAPSRKDQIR
jgi:hypothetical protein